MQYLFELSKIVVALIVLLQLVLPSGECMMQVRGTHSHVIASTSSCISFKVFLVSLKTLLAQHQSMTMSMLNSIVHKISRRLLIQYSHLSITHRY